jgi:GNAT superfamily N-acetyltransferase
MARSSHPGWAVERLSKSHDRTSFCCGKPLLDSYIQRLATQHEDKNMGRTYVAVVPPNPLVLGYYTISSGSIAFESVPEAIRRKLPTYPIPVAHLGRLAVDQSARGRRLGEFLLMDALARCLRISEQIGIHCVDVVAIDDDAARFYLKYGFLPLEDDPLHLLMPMKLVKKLPLQSSE